MNLIVLITILVSLTLANDGALSIYYICKRGEEVRTLRVEAEAESCRAYYTKLGLDELIGSAKQTKVCTEVVDGVKNNLISANWNCKSVSSKISK